MHSVARVRDSVALQARRALPSNRLVRFWCQIWVAWWQTWAHTLSTTADCTLSPRFQRAWWRRSSRTRTLTQLFEFALGSGLQALMEAFLDGTDRDSDFRPSRPERTRIRVDGTLLSLSTSSASDFEMEANESYRCPSCHMPGNPRTRCDCLSVFVDAEVHNLMALEADLQQPHPSERRCQDCGALIHDPSIAALPVDLPDTPFRFCLQCESADDLARVEQTIETQNLWFDPPVPEWLQSMRDARRDRRRNPDDWIDFSSSDESWYTDM